MPIKQEGELRFKSAVISVGASAELVLLRNFVLQEAGFNVTSTVDDHEALACIERGECGLLLMCYSLSFAVRKRLAEALRQYCPNAPIVSIANDRVDGPLFADTLVYGMEGPEALVAAIKTASREAVPNTLSNQQ